MRHIIFLLFLIPYPSQSFEKSIPSTNYFNTTNESQNITSSINDNQLKIVSNKKNIEKLNLKLNKYEKNHKEHLQKSKERIAEVDNSFKINNVEHSELKEKTNELSNTAWNYLNYVTTIFYGVLGLVITLAGIFVWRENSTLKERLMIEENDIQQKKRLIYQELEETKTMIVEAKKEMYISLDSLKRRHNISIKIETGEPIEDSIYSDIKQLSQFLDLENYTTLKRLSDSKLLSHEIQKDLDITLNTYKQQIKTKQGK